jgi:hypothetical protein
LQNLPVGREGEDDANRLAFVTEVMHYDALGGWRNFLKVESQ